MEAQPPPAAGPPAARHPDPRGLAAERIAGTTARLMPDRSEARTSARLFLVLVGAITMAGLLLRLPSFSNSLFADELSTYFIVSGHSLGRVIYLLQENSVDLNPPLYFVLAWATERLGDPAQSLRLISLLAGTATIPLTYLLGLWTVGRRAGLVGATLVALSPFLIFYSSEARPYPLLLLLGLLSTLALLRALEKGTAGWWIAYAACSCAAIYTHYTAVFLLAAQFVWAFWTRPEARPALFGANVAAAVGYVPWLPALLADTGSPGTKSIGFLAPFNLHNVEIGLAHWSIGHPYIALASLPGPAAIAMVVAAVAAASLGVALRLRRAGRNGGLPRLSAGTVLVLVLALATPVEIALYSSIGNTVWEARNLIASWPGLALAVGALVTGGGGLVRVVAVGLILAAFAIGAAKMLESSSQRPDYAAAVSFIDRVGRSGDPVVDLPAPTPGPLTALDVALAHTGRAPRERHKVFRIGLPSLRAELSAPADAPLSVPPAGAVLRQAAALAKGRSLFIVEPTIYALYHLQPAPLLGSRHRFRLTETISLPGIVPLSVYTFRDRHK